MTTPALALDKQSGWLDAALRGALRAGGRGAAKGLAATGRAGLGAVRAAAPKVAPIVRDAVGLQPEQRFFGAVGASLPARAAATAKNTALLPWSTRWPGLLRPAGMPPGVRPLDRTRQALGRTFQAGSALGGAATVGGLAYSASQQPGYVAQNAAWEAGVRDRATLQAIHARAQANVRNQLGDWHRQQALASLAQRQDVAALAGGDGRGPAEATLRAAAPRARPAPSLSPVGRFHLDVARAAAIPYIRNNVYAIQRDNPGRAAVLDTLRSMSPAGALQTALMHTVLPRPAAPDYRAILTEALQRRRQAILAQGRTLADDPWVRFWTDSLQPAAQRPGALAARFLRPRLALPWAAAAPHPREEAR